VKLPARAQEALLAGSFFVCIFLLLAKKYAQGGGGTVFFALNI